MLIDIHVHLQEQVLLDRVDDVMRECRESAGGDTRLLCNGTRPEDWADVAALSERFSEVIPAFGLHPWYVSKAGDYWEMELRDFLQRHRAAVGECGIDRWIEPRDEQLQERIFRRHLQIARELDLPIVIHCLRAWGWLMEILASEKLPRAMLIHSYGGSAEMIKPLKEFGAYFSFSGSIFEPKRQKLRDAAMSVPRDRLLVETDAPALIPPEQWRSHSVTTKDGEVQNHPANLKMVYAGLSDLLKWPMDELAGQVALNAKALLGELWNA